MTVAALVLMAAVSDAGETVVRAAEARIQEAQIAGPAQGGAWRLSTAGAVGDWFAVPRKTTLTITVSAAGEPAAGWPKAEVVLAEPTGDRRTVETFTVSSEKFRDYRCQTAVEPGTVAVLVAFPNDHYDPAKGEDRNLVVRDIRVDGAALAKEDPMDAEIDRRIRKHRTAETTLTVRDADGQPLASAPVTVRMTRHKFLFGCNIYKFDRCRTPRDNAEYKRRFRELLNFATIAFYWSSYERSPGETAFEHRKETAQWCARHGIRTKGHPLFWTLEPKWLAKRPPEEQEALQWARIEREIEQFDGLIETWDVLNEPCVGARQAKRRGATNALRLYRQRGPVKVILEAFQHAREAGPDATLILNDYNTSPEYEKVIRQALDGGASIDVIGIQSHMHGRYWGKRRAWSVCERFAKFGLPLHFTETTIVSGPKTPDGWHTTPEGEKKQARQTAEFYRILFSHPAVEAITWWDFSDQGAWQGAPAGFLRRDMSPKPVYHALKDLIKGEWWTGPLELTTDAKGQVTFRGFLGAYAVEANGRQATFRLEESGTAAVEAALAKRAQ
jgi:GH35 family endo-1,4-beta-xylanase